MRLSIPELAIGNSTSEVLTALTRANERIKAIFVFSYRPPPLLQQRLDFTTDEASIVEDAIVQRKATNLPFWDSLLLSCFNKAGGYERLLQQTTFHQNHKETFRRISKDEICRGHLTDLVMRVSADESYSFSSQVELSEARLAHLPLLDFHCPETLKNDRVVSEVCKHLFEAPVFIFSSGESYHAVGSTLVEAEDLRTFLVKSLFFAPVVDRAYVAHQMLEGACALRLSSSLAKPNVPKLKLCTGIVREGTDHKPQPQ